MSSKSAEEHAEHAEHLRLLLQLLREHELYAKRSKCLFNQPELEFLGHVVGCEGIKVDAKPLVWNWALPQNVVFLRTGKSLSQICAG